MVIILISGHDHCLADLLYRNNAGELDCEVAMIISNHVKAKPLANFYRIPYHLLSFPQNKRRCEEEMPELIGHETVCTPAVCQSNPPSPVFFGRQKDFFRYERKTVAVSRLSSCEAILPWR